MTKRVEEMEMRCEETERLTKESQFLCEKRAEENFTLK